MRKLVLGLGFGSDGVGLVTDYLCRTGAEDPVKKRVIVHNLAGLNKSEKVRVGNLEHGFSYFGSGTLRGATTILESDCIVNPVKLVEEYKELCNKGLKPKMHIEEECPLCTPYDTWIDESRNPMQEHVSQTVKQREKEGLKLHMGDYLYKRVFEIKMDRIAKYALDIIPDSFDSLKLREFYAAMDFIEGCENIEIHRSFICSQESNQSDDYIHEISQGVMEGIEYKDSFPFGELSASLFSEGLFHLYLVTRAYIARQGSDKLPLSENRCITIPGKRIGQEISPDEDLNTCILDIDMLRYAADKARKRLPYGATTLVITCLWHLHPFTDEDGKERSAWQVMEKNLIKEFATEEEFVEYIATELGLVNVLLSRSPYSDFMEKWKPKINIGEVFFSLINDSCRDQIKINEI